MAGMQLDHLLAKHLGWPLFWAPLLRVALKWTGWWALFQDLKPGLYEGGNWSEWFPSISVQVDGLDELPSGGGYSLVSDHPLGVLDGWALGIALKDRLDRVAFFAHPILAEFPTLASQAIPMKPGMSAAKPEARASLRKGAEHIARGGILVRFNSHSKSQPSPLADYSARAEIIPIWAANTASRKAGTWWTWLWMPRRLRHLQSIRVRFSAGLPSVEGVDQA